MSPVSIQKIRLIYLFEVYDFSRNFFFHSWFPTNYSLDHLLGHNNAKGIFLQWNCTAGYCYGQKNQRADDMGSIWGWDWVDMATSRSSTIPWTLLHNWINANSNVHICLNVWAIFFLAVREALVNLSLYWWGDTGYFLFMAHWIEMLLFEIPVVANQQIHLGQTRTWQMHSSFLVRYDC